MIKLQVLGARGRAYLVSQAGVKFPIDRRAPISLALRMECGHGLPKWADAPGVRSPAGHFLFRGTPNIGGARPCVLKGGRGSSEQPWPTPVPGQLPGAAPHATLPTD